jgi:hypothetical protein
VLDVETKEDEAGKLRPGSCVWLHGAGRLIRAAPNSRVLHPNVKLQWSP